MPLYSLSHCVERCCAEVMAGTNAKKMQPSRPVHPALKLTIAFSLRTWYLPCPRLIVVARRHVCRMLSQISVNLAPEFPSRNRLRRSRRLHRVPRILPRSLRQSFLAVIVMSITMVFSFPLPHSWRATARLDPHHVSTQLNHQQNPPQDPRRHHQ